MEEEEDPLPTPADPAAAMRVMALSAIGEFLLLLGLIFMLLGVASFMTDLLGIKGSGDLCVGLFLVAAALLVVLRSRAAIPNAAQMPRRPGKRSEQKSEAYR